MRGTLPNAARALLSLLKRREIKLVSETLWNDFMSLESHLDKIKARTSQEKRDFDVVSHGLFQLVGAEKTGLNLDFVQQCLGIVCWSFYCE